MVLEIKNKRGKVPEILISVNNFYCWMCILVHVMLNNEEVPVQNNSIISTKSRSTVTNIGNFQELLIVYIIREQYFPTNITLQKMINGDEIAIVF